MEKVVLFTPLGTILSIFNICNTSNVISCQQYRSKLVLNNFICDKSINAKMQSYLSILVEWTLQYIISLN